MSSSCGCASPRILDQMARHGDQPQIVLAERREHRDTLGFSRPSLRRPRPARRGSTTMSAASDRQDPNLEGIDVPSAELRGRELHRNSASGLHRRQPRRRSIVLRRRWRLRRPGRAVLPTGGRVLRENAAAVYRRHLTASCIDRIPRLRADFGRSSAARRRPPARSVIRRLVESGEVVDSRSQAAASGEARQSTPLMQSRSTMLAHECRSSNLRCRRRRLSLAARVAEGRSGAPSSSASRGSAAAAPGSRPTGQADARAFGRRAAEQVEA